MSRDAKWSKRSAHHAAIRPEPGSTRRWYGWQRAINSECVPTSTICPVSIDDSVGDLERVQLVRDEKDRALTKLSKDLVDVGLARGIDRAE